MLESLLRAPFSAKSIRAPMRVIVCIASRSILPPVMMRSLRSAVPLPFALLCVLATRPLWAAPEIGAVSLRYDVAQGCPAVGAFLAEVAQRTRRARFVDQAGTPQMRKMQISVRVEGDAMVGELALLPALDASAVRRVRGRTCSEVVSALALIAALAFDPDALSNQQPNGDSAGDSPAAPPPPNPSPTPSATAILVLVPAPGARPAVPETPAAPAGPVRRPMQGLASFGAMATGETALGAAPLFGPGGFAEVGYRWTDLVAPLLRVSAAKLITREVDGPPPARFGAGLFLFEGCPLRIGLGERFELRPCAGYETGTITVTGVPHESIPFTASSDAPWRALVETLRLRFSPYERLFFTAEIRANEPLRRDSFVYQPNVAVYTVPSVSAAGGLGLGLEIF